MAHLLAREGRGLACSGLVLVDTVYISPARLLGSGVNSNYKIVAPTMPADMPPGTRDEILASLVRANVLCSSWQPPLWDNCKMPSAVLLRAMDSIPQAAPPGSDDTSSGTEEADGNMSKCRLDALRDLDDLGWDETQPGLVRSVVHTPGHHYALFADENISSTTESLKQALRQLEGGNL
ncbi:thioesterase domain-containing protein [Colletotrichum graminicola M1.001]|uniref:Thioesterase domain-containing protein n=1 Tax=Colletotrichum graminicola (strain M1.001 / M2 / FGSC 10212) TaxID=645133 RepID=E3R0S9_COLGM|nr:thioesterase domain-containing protein [Colletotrichum graminicola M1.001]EFQ36717.1 thioesterase domain-containing protein [Colletotrichum graminicola M1.001]